MADSKTVSNAPAAGPGPSPGAQPQTQPTDYNPGLVSVIIPTYNRERLIVEALDSVRMQTYRPIETLVVDDGSTDNTVSVCQQVAEQWKADPGLQLHILKQPHKGACAARNLGLRESKGEFIQFLDSDDLLVPDSIEKRLAHMTPSVDAVFGDVLRWNPSGVYELGWSYEDCPPGGADIAYHLTKNISTNAPIHRRASLLNSAGFDESLSRGQDMEFHTRLFCAGRMFVHSPAPAFVFRCHDGARISNGWTSRDAYGYLYAFRKIKTTVMQMYPVCDWPATLNVLSAAILGRGIELVRHRRFFAARQYFAEARRTGDGHTLVLANGYGRLGRFVCWHIGIYWGEILRATIVTPCLRLTSLLRSLLRHRAEPRAHATDRLAVPGERPGRAGDKRVEGQSV